LKIVCIIATHDRYLLTLTSIRMLKSQTVPVQIVIVGDSPKDRRLANSEKCKYVHHENYPIGKKWQAGVDFARKLNPDAILICGSDNWLSPNWCKTCSKYIQQGYDLVGKSIFEICHIPPKRNIEVIRRKTFLPIGSGRMFSKKILNRIGWQLFPISRDSGLDGKSYLRVVNHKGKVKDIEEYKNVNVLSLRSTWKNKNTWKRYRVGYKLKKLRGVSNPVRWLKRFPNSIRYIKKLVPNVKL